MNTGDAEVVQKKALTYQEVNGRRQEIASQYILGENGEVGFKLGEYDRSQQLVIDPVLRYSTFLGSQADEVPSAIDIDADGNAYITGYTRSINFPTKNPLQAEKHALRTAFVTKLNPDGSDLVFSTYLGGNIGLSSGTDIAVDEAGNVWVIGSTAAMDFPVVNPLQLAIAGSEDIFVTKLKGDGSAILFSTYLGGSGMDSNGGLKVDRHGDVLLTGYTTSINFPTVNAFQPVHAESIINPCIFPQPPPFPCIRLPLYKGDEDAFVTKLKGDGSALVFSTYLGGSRGDDGQDLAVDGEGNIYVIGVTDSIDFPTANPLQAANAGYDDPNVFNFQKAYDAFVAKYNASGALLYSTYFGGSANDFGRAISLDEAGRIYLLGETASPDFPTQTPLQPTRSGGSTDLFVPKLNHTGSAIIYSTYLGGSSNEYGGDLKVDAQGNAYITGKTQSTDFPTVNPIQQVLNPGGPCRVIRGNTIPHEDVIVAKLSAQGSSLVYSTFLGGSCPDVGKAIAIDRFGRAYVAGWTTSDNFPVTPGAFQQVLTPPDFAGLLESFIIKIGD